MSKRFLIGCALLVVSNLGMLDALDFSVTGGWDLTIDATDMTGGAGSDIASDYVSAANAVLMDITGTIVVAEPWYITVNKSDVEWDGSLHLSMQRSSDGTGTGTISGGTAWLELTATAQSFFQGTEDRASIQIQLMLSGVSVTLGSKVYTTQVVLTLLDAP